MVWEEPQTKTQIKPQCHSVFCIVSQFRLHHRHTAEGLSMIELVWAKAEGKSICCIHSVWPPNLLFQLFQATIWPMKLIKGFICIKSVLVCVSITLMVTCWSSLATISLFGAQSDVLCLLVKYLLRNPSASVKTHHGYECIQTRTSAACAWKKS